ncbi:hypothetical protein [Spirillospora sp. CA-294931]|uniref:hypothetical protein n=1 Tax=Spirillospora sp. CA-294931 TaxID=3240042 RepID=UPI003D8A1087
MTTELENRLRAAFEAGTAEVQAPPEPGWDDAPPRRVLVPVLAAAVVVTIVVAVVAVLRPGGGDEPELATGNTLAPLVPTDSPRFVLRQPDATPVVVELRTGRTVAALRPPDGYKWERAGAITGASDNRTFFLTVVAKRERVQYVARVQLDERGRPGIARLVARAPRAGVLDAGTSKFTLRPTNQPSPWSRIDAIVPSPDGTELAMKLSAREGEGLALWTLSDARLRVWESATPSARSPGRAMGAPSGGPPRERWANSTRAHRPASFLGRDRPRPPRRSSNSWPTATGSPPKPIRASTH